MSKVWKGLSLWGLFTRKCVERVCFWEVWPTQKGCFGILTDTLATELFPGAKTLESMGLLSSWCVLDYPKKFLPPTDTWHSFSQH